MFAVRDILTALCSTSLAYDSPGCLGSRIPGYVLLETRKHKSFREEKSCSGHLLVLNRPAATQ